MNKRKLLQIIEHYHNNFDDNWILEDYKWIEVARFQKNWNIGSNDFINMLKKSINESSNLVASRNYFPINVVIKVAKQKEEQVRSRFYDLFDESMTLSERINMFTESIKALKESLGFDTSDGSDLRFVSTMLFLRYPNNYSIYKYSDLVKFSEQLETGIRFKKGQTNSIEKVKTLIHLIRDYLVDINHPVIDTYKKKLESSELYYNDEKLLMLAQNIFWYAARTYENLKDNEKYILPTVEEGKITHSVYSSHISEKGKTIDFIKKARRDKQVGKSGESFVLEFENYKLSAMGKKAVWVSENQGDGLGYDILSYDENGNKKYIEVKTTKYDENTLFYISATELAAAKKYGQQYYLYRVYKFGTENKIAIYQANRVEQLCTTPSIYAVVGDDS